MIGSITPSGQVGLKNLSLSPAVNDLGLGDQLQDQVQARLDDERKKKMMGLNDPSTMAGAAMNPAVMSLGLSKVS